MSINLRDKELVSQAGHPRSRPSSEDLCANDSLRLPLGESGQKVVVVGGTKLLQSQEELSEVALA